MTTITKVSRREFLKLTGAAGGGLVLGLYLPLDRNGAPAVLRGSPLKPNVWLQIETDGTVTIWVARSEMGQGVRTSIPMLVAEELEVEWSTVQIEQALADPIYDYHQSTNASRSVRESWEPLRKAGATGREMLIAAAAEIWAVEKRTCRARTNGVIHKPTGRRLTYGELAETAAQMPVPEEVPLKDLKDFRLLGRPLPRVDIPEKVDGTAVFGLDVRVRGMLYGTVVRCPVFGGKVAHFDASKVEAVPGVRSVIEVDGGVGVVGDSTWSAMQGRRALEITWEGGPHRGLSSAGISRMFAEAADHPAVVGMRDGNVTKGLGAASQRINAVYEIPYQAHAPMEPMTCTAHVQDGRCEVWAPTQTPLAAQARAAKVAGLPRESVVVHTTFLGGGFGRKQMQDDIADAVQLSKAVGAPVKVTWTREDDIQHDFYRPASYHRLSAGFEAAGWPIAWSHRIVAPSMISQNWEADVARGEPWEGVTPEEVKEWSEHEAMAGAAELPYAIPNIRVDYVRVKIPVPIGAWRSVFYSQNAFVNECFLDELAAAAGKDPYELRLQLLSKPASTTRWTNCPGHWTACSPDPARMKAVLELAATKAAWGTPLPAGRGRGIACQPYLSCNTYVAQVAEVSVARDGTVRVHRVVCAVDCGFVLSPDTVVAQMEGSIVWGLTAALKGAITIDNGRVQQSNFDDYPMLRMNEMPEIEVYIVPSTETPGGAGEPGVPPIAPAVANAVFAATGKRIRRLPIRAENLRRA